jgi:DNA polymerase III gamma/tau subunit
LNKSEPFLKEIVPD